MKKFPLPHRVRGTAGSINVKEIPPFLVGGQVCWGSWEEDSRTIKIDKELATHAKWVTYFHELTHAALCDAGVDEVLSDEMTEAVCDAVATARLHEQFKVS